MAFWVVMMTAAFFWLGFSASALGYATGGFWGALGAGLALSLAVVIGGRRSRSR